MERQKRTSRLSSLLEPSLYKVFRTVCELYNVPMSEMVRVMVLNFSIGILKEMMDDQSLFESREGIKKCLEILEGLTPENYF